MSKIKTATILVIIGLLSIGSSIYIKERVKEGKAQIESAQEKVDRGNQIFSLTPETKEVGQELSSPFQHKIDEGNEAVLAYSMKAKILNILGIVLLIAGGLLFLVPKKK